MFTMMSNAVTIGTGRVGLSSRIDIEVDAGVPVIGIVLGRPLDPAGSAVVDLDHVAGGALLGEVARHCRDEIVTAAPAFVHLGCATDRRERRNVARRGRTQGDE